MAYLPLFFGRIIFFRDIAHYAFPLRAFLRESFVRGEFPAWNPYQGLGIPVFGQPQYGVFYPPNWLFFLVGSGWVASMFNWQSFLHMAWGAAGVCWLARRLGAPATAIVIAGLAWALSGYTSAEWTSGMRLGADAWVPWAAVGQVALLDSLRAGGRAWCRGLCKAALPSLFAVLYGEVFLAMVGAGFGVVFAVALYLSESAATPAPPRARFRWLLASVCAVALAFGAGAVVIVPARALGGSTERAAPLPRAIAEVCSLHPLRLAEFVLPNSMGDAYTAFPAASVIGETRLDGLPLSYSVYMGASVMALVLVAFGRGRRLALVLGALAGLALLLALGRHTPVHGLFRHVALPLAYMRYPEKYTTVVVGLVALLAGLGARRVLSSEPQPWRRTALLLLLILALGVIAYRSLPPAWMVFAVRGALLGSTATLGVLAAQFLAARDSRLAPVVLVAIVAIDLAVAMWPLQGFGSRQLADRPPPAARAIRDQVPLDGPPPRVYRSNQTTAAVNKWLPAAATPEEEPRLVATLITNTVNAWGLATLPGYDAAIPSMVDQVWSAGLDVGQSALRLLGAAYVVLPVADPRAPANDRPGLEPILDPLPGSRLYRVPGTLPRVFWSRHADVVSDEQALARLYEPAVVAGASVLLAPQGNPIALAAPLGRAGSCTLESFHANRLVAACTGSDQGIVVFVEQYDPGWHATVDGRPAEILRANLLMRALVVEPGTHHIVLEYRTPGLATGATISALCLALLGLLSLLA